MYFFRFRENQTIKSLKIVEQFLNHSEDLIKEYFLKPLNSKNINFKRDYWEFIYKVGSSSEQYFKVVECSKSQQKAYFKRILESKKDYDKYIFNFNNKNNDSKKENDNRKTYKAILKQNYTDDKSKNTIPKGLYSGNTYNNHKEKKEITK